MFSTSGSRCSPVVTSVNEVFLDGGRSVGRSVYRVVKLTPSFVPVRVTSQNATHFNQETRTCCFSGWNAYVNPAYSATTTYYVPTVSNPPQLSCLFGVTCQAAEWVGIVNTANTLIQTGTLGGVGFETFYTMWYEFYPAPSVTCDSIHAADVISAYVYQESNVWYTYVDDQTEGLACGSSLQQANPGYVTQFYMERPEECYFFGCVIFDLPQFTTLQFQDIAINGFNPITSFVYNSDSMYNCNAYNIQLGNPTNFDYFLETWLTSACA